MLISLFAFSLRCNGDAQRVLVRRRLQDVNRRLVLPVVISCFGVNVTLIVIGVDDSMLIHCWERALLKDDLRSCFLGAALGID